MSDRDEIMETINMYGWAIDSKQCHLLAQVFAVDVEADYDNLQWRSLADCVRDMTEIHSKMGGTQHLIGNHQIQIEGDTATCRSYAHVVLTKRSSRGRLRSSVGATYEDELIRTEDGWRVKRRKARALWRDGDSLAD